MRKRWEGHTCSVKRAIGREGREDEWRLNVSDKALATREGRKGGRELMLTSELSHSDPALAPLRVSTGYQRSSVESYRVAQRW
jgi:hypothetical protein